MDSGVANLVDDEAACAGEEASVGEPHAAVAARLQVARGVARAHEGAGRYVGALKKFQVGMTPLKTKLKHLLLRTLSLR